MAKNEYRKNTPDEIPEEKPKSTGGKQKESSGKVSGFRAFLADERVRKIGGIFLVLFSAYLFVACLSYLFSGGKDQYLILAPPDAVVTETTLYANWMGRWALISPISSCSTIWEWVRSSSPSCCFCGV